MVTGSKEDADAGSTVDAGSSRDQAEASDGQGSYEGTATVLPEDGDAEAPADAESSLSVDTSVEATEDVQQEQVTVDSADEEASDEAVTEPPPDSDAASASEAASPGEPEAAPKDAPVTAPETVAEASPKKGWARLFGRKKSAEQVAPEPSEDSAASLSAEEELDEVLAATSEDGEPSAQAETVPVEAEEAEAEQAPAEEDAEAVVESEADAQPEIEAKPSVSLRAGLRASIARERMQAASARAAQQADVANEADNKDGATKEAGATRPDDADKKSDAANPDDADNVDSVDDSDSEASQNSQDEKDAEDSEDTDNNKDTDNDADSSVPPNSRLGSGSSGSESDLVPPKKKRRWAWLVAIVVVVVVAAIAIPTGIIASQNAATSRAGTVDYYTIGSDKVPSVKFVLGQDRTVSKFSSSTSSGVTTQTITYQVPGSGQNSEMLQYAFYLHNKDNFTTMPDSNFTGAIGKGGFYRASVDAGQELVVGISYDTTGYIITVTKKPGQVNSPPSATDTAPAQPATPALTPSIEPAEGWAANNNYSVPAFSNGSSIIIIFTTDISYFSGSPQDYVTSVQQDKKSAYPGDNISDVTAANVGTYQGWEFTDISDGYLQRSVYLFNGTTAYEIQCMAGQGDYNSLKNDYQTMINSFTLS